MYEVVKSLGSGLQIRSMRFSRIMAIPNVSIIEETMTSLALVMGASGYTMEGIEDKVPADGSGYSQLLERYDQAFAANERPRQVLALSSVMNDLFGEC